MLEKMCLLTASIQPRASDMQVRIIQNINLLSLFSFRTTSIPSSPDWFLASGRFKSIQSNSFPNIFQSLLPRKCACHTQNGPAAISISSQNKCMIKDILLCMFSENSTYSNSSLMAVQLCTSGIMAQDSVSDMLERSWKRDLGVIEDS